MFPSSGISTTFADTFFETTVSKNDECVHKALRSCNGAVYDALRNFFYVLFVATVGFASAIGFAVAVPAIGVVVTYVMAPSFKIFYMILHPVMHVSGEKNGQRPLYLTGVSPLAVLARGHPRSAGPGL